ncbi:UNVERIFIED_CONTAM: hypothetical protein FKN15_006086 [Acipenser sinensis]
MIDRRRIAEKTDCCITCRHPDKRGSHLLELQLLAHMLSRVKPMWNFIFVITLLTG